MGGGAGDGAVTCVGFFQVWFACFGLSGWVPLSGDPQPTSLPWPSPWSFRNVLAAVSAQCSQDPSGLLGGDGLAFIRWWHVNPRVLGRGGKELSLCFYPYPSPSATENTFN